MAGFTSKFSIGESVWTSINGIEFVGVIQSVTFHKDNIVYGIHNEEFPWPESYLSIPEKALEKYDDKK